MRSKRKVSLTLDEDLCADIEKAAKTFNMAKSQLAQKAFRLWLKRRPRLLWQKVMKKWPKKIRSLPTSPFKPKGRSCNE